MLQLPYDLNALEPRMSADTLMYHHGKHLQTYMDNVNRLTASSPYEDMSLKELVCNTTGALFNNAAQAWNHILFFKQLSPKEKMMMWLLKSAILKKASRSQVEADLLECYNGELDYANEAYVEDLVKEVLRDEAER